MVELQLKAQQIEFFHTSSVFNLELLINLICNTCALLQAMQSKYDDCHICD